MNVGHLNKLADVCQRYGILMIETEGLTISILGGRSPLTPFGPLDREGIDWATCTLYFSKTSTYFDAMHEVAHLIWHEDPHNTNETLMLGLEALLHKACGTYRPWVAWMKGQDVSLEEVWGLLSADLRKRLRASGYSHVSRSFELSGNSLCRDLLLQLYTEVLLLGYAPDLRREELVAPRTRKIRTKTVAKLLRDWARQITKGSDAYLYLPGQ